MAINLTGRDGACPFLLQLREAPTWARIVEATDEACSALDLSEALTEVSNTRHRCYVIAITLWLPPEHFHLRMAGVLPARNKMLDVTHPIDPPTYEVIQVPKVLLLACARLHGGTIVRPLLSELDKVFLTLSCILLTGDTVGERYVVYRHLVDLGLAGPTAPVLQWSSLVRHPTAARGVLPFHALTDLPAELLAAPYPNTSWAFDSSPRMTPPQWENYRQRHTSRVVLSPLPGGEGCHPRPYCLGPSCRYQVELITEWLPRFSTILWKLGLLFWKVLVLVFEQCPSRVVMKSPWPRTAGTQGPTAHTDAEGRSHTSDSTELRMLPVWQGSVRGAVNRIQQLDEGTAGSSSLIPAESTFAVGNMSSIGGIVRPSVIIKGCLPKGFHLPFLP